MPLISFIVKSQMFLTPNLIFMPWIFHQITSSFFLIYTITIWIPFFSCFSTNFKHFILVKKNYIFFNFIHFYYFLYHFLLASIFLPFSSFISSFSASILSLFIILILFFHFSIFFLFTDDCLIFFMTDFIVLMLLML